MHVFVLKEKHSCVFNEPHRSPGTTRKFAKDQKKWNLNSAFFSYFIKKD